MNTLIGTYECKADAKGRIMMPSSLKKQLAPVMQKGFVLKRAVFQPCLELYPHDEWEALMNKVNK
ncbi:MAG: MraZ N-terminal domain containing protein, partial [Bacteroidia bacterium]|nr:MraZ N-terminal domain containing protein [Bacteroidia bacterium]